MSNLRRTPAGGRYGFTIYRVDELNPDGSIVPGGGWFEVCAPDGKVLKTCSSPEEAYEFIEQFRPSVSPPTPPMPGPSCR